MPKLWKLLYAISYYGRWKLLYMFLWIWYEEYYNHLLQHDSRLKTITTYAWCRLSCCRDMGWWIRIKDITLNYISVWIKGTHPLFTSTPIRIAMYAFIEVVIANTTNNNQIVEFVGTKEIFQMATIAIAYLIFGGLYINLAQGISLPWGISHRDGAT